MARNIIQALVLALLFTPSPAAAGDLTLRDLIELHRSGLGDELLIAVIDADGGPFTLTFADIQDLKGDGIGERVITALVRTGARLASTGDGGAAPVVQVQQHVINYVVPTVVLIDATPEARRRRSEAPPAPPPPATWVKSRPSVPAATWITPRNPKPKDTPAPGKPEPK